MDIKIIKINGKGDYRKEYVWLKVKKDCNLGNFILTDCTYNDEGDLSNKWQHTYWFPEMDVSAGEYISLRTRPGSNETNEAENGQITHRLHWGLRTSVWNDTDDTAMLMHISDWSVVKSE